MHSDQRTRWRVRLDERYDWYQRLFLRVVLYAEVLRTAWIISMRRVALRRPTLGRGST